MTDPFGDLEQPEEIKTVAKSEQGEEGPVELVITFKEGPGYEQTWHVVHAPSVQKANEILSDPEFKELLARQKKINQWFRGGDSGSSAPSTSAPPGATQSPDGETHQCKHGQMQYRSGIAKASGKPYRLFGCPHPVRAEQCDAVWPK